VKNRLAYLAIVVSGFSSLIGMQKITNTLSSPKFISKTTWLQPIVPEIPIEYSYATAASTNDFKKQFASLKTKADKKKLFNKLALKWHPDNDGDKEIFNRLRESYTSSLINSTVENEEPIVKNSNYNPHVDSFGFRYPAGVIYKVFRGYHKKPAGIHPSDVQYSSFGMRMWPEHFWPIRNLPPEHPSYQNLKTALEEMYGCKFYWTWENDLTSSDDESVPKPELDCQTMWYYGFTSGDKNPTWVWRYETKEEYAERKYYSRTWTDVYREFVF
jgi:hypothetical protein